MKIKLTLKRAVTIGILVVLCAAVGAVVHMVSAPVHGTVSMPSRSVVQRQKAAATPSPASSSQSPYYALDLPSGYKAQPGNTTVPGLLYQQTIMKPSTSGTLIASVAVLQEPSLANNASYSQRVQNPAQYTMTTQQYDGDTVTIANDKQSAAVVAFWPHGGRLATIGVSSGVENPVADGNQAELAVIKTVLSGWQWR